MLEKIRRNDVLWSYDSENWYDYIEKNVASLTDKALNMPLTSMICCLKEKHEARF